MDRMLSVEELQDIQNVNALEEWPYYDSCVVNGLVAQPNFAKYAKAGFYSTYAAMGAQTELPFFKLRNRGTVGLAYCNMDVIDRFNLPFHCFGIGVAFVGSAIGDNTDPAQQVAGRFFSAELPKHCGFTLQVGQDEKVATHAGYLNAGQGLFGAYNQLDARVSTATVQTQNFTNGRPNRWNVYPLESPIQIPRNETIQCLLKLSQQARNVLTAMAGPGNIVVGSGGVAYNRSLIRVTLYGVREVQLRNLQHY